MRISERTVKALGRIATGDEANGVQLAPYQTGPELVAFFNEFGFNDVYGGGRGFPSRWMYAEEKIRSHNDTQFLILLVEGLVDPRRFLDSQFSVEAAVDYLNQYLKFDGYEVLLVGNLYRVRDLTRGTISLDVPNEHTDPLSHKFIEEQIIKCDKKITEGDFDGSITNARTLLEAVLLALEEQLVGSRQDYDGDLPRLFKRVRNQLNLDPARQDISDSLRQLLTGLVSIVNGISSMRNSMSDSHATSYRPSKHHADLAVNSSKTIASFLFETYQYQKDKGLIRFSAASGNPS
jgi:hypothetical protein